MAVRYQGAKAILRVLHFIEELFATVDAATNGYDALEKSCGTSPSVHHCTVAPPTPSAGDRGVAHGKVKEGGKQLKVVSSHVAN